MAKNRVYEESDQVRVPVAEGVKSGDPVIVGNGLPGVALVDRAADGTATVQFDGAFLLAVKGANKAGEKDIAVGDIIYKKGAELNVNNEEGTRFGYALDTVAKSKTETIRVKVGY